MKDLNFMDIFADVFRFLPLIFVYVGVLLCLLPLASVALIFIALIAVCCFEELRFRASKSFRL